MWDSHFALFPTKLTKLKRNLGSLAQRKQNAPPLTKTRLPKKMGRPNTLRVSIFLAKNGQPSKKWTPDCQQIERLSFSSVRKTNPQKWNLFPKTSFFRCAKMPRFFLSICWLRFSLSQKQIVGSWFLRAPKWGLFVLRTTPPAKFYSALVRCETPNIGVWFLRVAQATTL